MQRLRLPKRSFYSPLKKPTDLYSILGVNNSADISDIKKAFREKSLQCHPDKFPDDKSKESEFKLLSEAYTVLSDTELRAQYDRERRLNPRTSYENFTYDANKSSRTQHAARAAERQREEANRFRTSRAYKNPAGDTSNHYHRRSYNFQTRHQDDTDYTDPRATSMDNQYKNEHKFQGDREQYRKNVSPLARNYHMFLGILFIGTITAITKSMPEKKTAIEREREQKMREYKLRTAGIRYEDAMYDQAARNSNTGWRLKMR